MAIDYISIPVRFIEEELKSDKRVCYLQSYFKLSFLSADYGGNLPDEEKIIETLGVSKSTKRKHIKILLQQKWLRNNDSKTIEKSLQLVSKERFTHQYKTQRDYYVKIYKHEVECSLLEFKAKLAEKVYDFKGKSKANQIKYDPDFRRASSCVIGKNWKALLQGAIIRDNHFIVTLQNVKPDNENFNKKYARLKFNLSTNDFSKLEKYFPEDKKVKDDLLVKVKELQLCLQKDRAEVETSFSYRAEAINKSISTVLRYKKSLSDTSHYSNPKLILKEASTDKTFEDVLELNKNSVSGRYLRIGNALCFQQITLRRYKEDSVKKKRVYS